ncbi:uncharacterized protein LOC117119376 [Anneissia japonica]|uniref:uncharacterized protein LOC117119376 n=1 Tax=Anneissia japonica TaxID=1529436 RepID=UPI001425941D|nr:uncharacterized protein LOC117119376 [Anneissia japonica]
MPRPPASSSSDSDSNTEQSSITDEVDLIVGDLYSSDVVQHLERPRLLSFSNTFDDLELRCVCRTGKCRYSWPRQNQRPLYTYSKEPSHSGNKKPEAKKKVFNKNEKTVLTALRSLVSSATGGRKSGRKSVKEVTGDNTISTGKFENVTNETNRPTADCDSDSESASATCDLTIPFQSYVDAIKITNAKNESVTTSSSSSDSDDISTDNYSEEEFRRVGEAGRTATLTELEMVEVITPSPIVRLVYMETNVEPSCAETTKVASQFQNLPSKSTNDALNEATAEQTSPNPKSRKRSKKTFVFTKALNMKIKKPKFLASSKKGKVLSNSRKQKYTPHESNGTTDHTSTTLTPTCSATSNKVTPPPTKSIFTKDFPSCKSSKQEQNIKHPLGEHCVIPKDENQKDTHFDKRELFLSGASNIHEYVVHDTTNSGPLCSQRSGSISSNDSKSTESEVEEDEVRSIAHDLRSLHIISNDNPIRLIGFGKLGGKQESYANQKLPLLKRSNRVQNTKYVETDFSNDLKFSQVKEEKHLYDDHVEYTTCNDSDVNTSDSETDAEESWRAVYDFTKPLHRDFTPEWSDESSSTDNSANSDIFSSDDDDLDISDNYSVLQLKKLEGLTKSEKLREQAPIRLIGFSTIR